ncbi:hypothetical protein EJ07DRAFT_159173 [Lizonia empirigonia]|nr:hypothetical protein EJ07DRAFT_159173 [Lizonia empirigonia]
MSFTLDDPNVPFLPPEIHAAIAQHVNCHDLPNYRLASYKVTTWRRWTKYCQEQAKRTDLAPGQSALYTELGASQQLFEAYRLRLNEEKQLIVEIARVFKTKPPSGRMLPNLEEVHVVKGAYQLENRQVRMMDDCDTIPLTVPLRDWKGDRFPIKPFIKPPSTSRRSTIARSAELAKKWRFDGLTIGDWSIISPSSKFEVGHQPDITDITISIGRPQIALFGGAVVNRFALYLYRWRNLESLSLDLKNRSKDVTGSRGSFRTIQDTFKISDNFFDRLCPKGPITWPKLHTLSLRRMDTTADALVALVARHSSTLRNLTLHALTLMAARTDPLNQRSWSKVFQSVGATTTLDKATLSGDFKYQFSRSQHVDCDDEATAKRMVSLILDLGEHTSPGESREPESKPEIGTI